VYDEELKAAYPDDGFEVIITYERTDTP